MVELPMESHGNDGRIKQGSRQISNHIYYVNFCSKKKTIWNVLELSSWIELNTFLFARSQEGPSPQAFEKRFRHWRGNGGGKGDMIKNTLWDFMLKKFYSFFLYIYVV